MTTRPDTGIGTAAGLRAHDAGSNAGLSPDARGERDAARASSEPVLVADVLSKHYAVRRGLFGHASVNALNGVSFSLAQGRTLAVVGESGSGKSTLARQLTMIETPSGGTLTIGGERVTRFGSDVPAALRRRVQMVFQNPFASLNPRKTIAQTLDEPLAINTPLDRAARAARVADAMRVVGLRPEHARRYPHMFSGGQRQRIAIARAMIVEPRIVVADEPVSALDVSIQAQILNLFMDLQQQYAVSFVFISHNLAVVEHVADDVLVMYFGGVVELGDKRRVLSRPRHPYTRSLLSATPAIRASERRLQVRLSGELPSPLNPPSGCSFHPRCPMAVERCRVERPALRDVDGRSVACHRAEETGE
ncbi:dipeptide ABC transporter ATP-binding protein [Pararobbsia silviterrae]|uniref:Dipeptide ABC transporter ATP-binding protein n=1 Tax=Pararobbsia silviterrae TaxID=1792498 RepID=A0A494Y755_9BURK|nr:dipeptide ABC transporter ATP-binding protein [Pararobbsia silviterrae]RKP58551.1 dipeptide ABC transporter ATP-binding protein [Pararobbsia silviterrae]